MNGAATADTRTDALERPDLLDGILAGLARSRPAALAIAFEAEDGLVTELSFRQLHHAAERFAAALAAIGIRPGDVVVLVLRHTPELPAAFWGAMGLGAIPSIFPYLSEKLDPALYFERVRALVASSGASAVIASEAFERDLAPVLAGLPCRVLTLEAATAHAAGALPAPNADGARHEDDIALLQHSSGTTGLQKGVALSHRAVLNQVRDYGEAIQLAPDDVVVSWLPLYHDMGLIAGFVMPVVSGVPLVLMSPFRWVREPVSLLRAIERYAGTLCWLPNFAYNHIARSVRSRDAAELDLRSIRALINCSEPVRHDSHTLLLDKLAASGLRPEALAVSYAMAENTFAVTQTTIGIPARVDWVDASLLQTAGEARPMPEAVPGAVPVVSCGPPIRHCEVRVVDAEGAVQPERRVGEIEVRSPSMLTGYYQRPDLTAAALHGGWYRAGDLGYLADGELYVNGRKKDLIIVGGKNIHPTDLEALAAGLPGLIPGRAVAFGVVDERLGSEAIVMVCEVDESVGAEALPVLERQLRRRVVEALDVTLGDVRLVPGRWLIKTSSGKLARADNRRKYLTEVRPAAKLVATADQASGMRLPSP